MCITPPCSLVIETLKDMEPGRKCFRLVGGVLVERTVQEVLPALRTNTEKVHAHFPHRVVAWQEGWFAIAAMTTFECVNCEVASRGRTTLPLVCHIRKVRTSAYPPSPVPQMTGILEGLERQLQEKGRLLTELREKHNIRFQGDREEGGANSKEAPAAQGVLVGSD